MNLLKSKKGVGIRNIILPLIVVLMVAFTFFVTHRMQLETQNIMINNIDIIGDNPTAVRNLSKSTEAFSYLDLVVAILALSLIFGIAVTSFRLATSRVFFAIVLFTSIIYGFIGYFLSYLGGQIVLSNQFSSVIIFYPKTILIITNLHWIAFAQLIIGSIALYAKKEKGQFTG